MTAPENVAKRVLIVDDDRDTREILVRLLTSQGYESLAVASGEEALAAMRAEPIDVVLLDVMMPGMDGLQVCEKLRADESLRAIPVILLTAKDDLATRAKGMALGVGEYLTKPINKKELFTRLRSQLHSREIALQLERTAASLDAKS